MTSERPDLRLVLPAVAAWLVAWQAPAVPVQLVVAGAAGGAVVAVALLTARRGPRATVAAAVCGCAAASALVTGLHTSSRTAGPLADLADERGAVAVVGVLTDDPRRAVRRPEHARDLVVVRLRVEQLDARGRSHRLRSPVVLLSTDPAWLDLLPSQRVRAEGLLRPAEPGDDVAAVLSGRGSPAVLTPPSRVQRVAGRLRQGLRDAAAPLPEAERGLLPGLVVGDVSRLDPQVREDFRTVGLAHLVAVSGTNCSIVVGAALLLAVRLRLGARASPAIALLALVGFVVLARPSPSVLRASVMGVVGLLALATGSRRAAVPALSAAVLVLVFADPDLARTPGFALSVLATAGLLLLAPPWTRALSRRMPMWLAAAVAVPAAAQAACGPVVVAISSQLGLLSVPANLLAVPAVAPATVAGVLAALTAPVALPVAKALAWVGWLPTAWLVLVARVGAGVPGAAAPWPGGEGGALLLAALTAVALVCLTRRRLRAVALAVAGGVAVSTVGLAVVRPAWPPPGWFAVVCDVGQGDALVLAAGDGAAVVVDAGPDPQAVDGCLRRLGVRAVPVVVLTHAHADHVSGLPGVLRGRQVGLVQVGPVDEPEEQAERVAQWAADAGVPVARPGLGEVRTVGRLRWEVLAPTRPYRGTRSDPNNASLVLRVDVGGTRLLLPGDVEPEAQEDLLARGVDVRADVLKTPHHGSAYQSERFLDAVGARVVVTSVGTGNTYGHPASATLERLAGGGAASFRTDLDGDVALVHRAGRLLVVGRAGGGSTPTAVARAPPRPPGARSRSQRIAGTGRRRPVQALRCVIRSRQPREVRVRLRLALCSAVSLSVCVTVQPAAAAPPQARPTDSSCPAGVIPGDDFLDVPASGPHEAAVDCLVHWRVTSGRTPALYEPTGVVTREQMASFLARLLLTSGGSLPAASRDHFTDDDTSGHQDSINRLAEAGVVSGTGAGTFHPRRAVTRAQMAAFLVRAYDYRATRAGKPTLTSDADYFPDDEAEQLEPQINAAARAGFTGGFPDGTYRPGLSVRRDQMASFLTRVLDAFVDDLGATVPPVPAPAQLTAQTPITQRGAGMARVGMTLRQVEAATGRQWFVEEFETFDRYCYYAVPAGLEETFYAIIEAPAGGPPADPRDGILSSLSTSAYMGAGGRAAYGLGVRDSYQRVQQIAGAGMTVEPHTYDPEGVYVNLDSPDAPGLRLRLEISNGIVEAVHGGGPAASYVEGCA